MAMRPADAARELMTRDDRSREMVYERFRIHDITRAQHLLLMIEPIFYLENITTLSAERLFDRLITSCLTRHTRLRAEIRHGDTMPNDYHRLV